MKKSGLFFLLAVGAIAAFSGVVFAGVCDVQPGEKYFAVTKITPPLPWGTVGYVAEGMSSQGEVAVLATTSGMVQVFVRNKDGGMKLVADGTAENYFFPQRITDSGAIAGYRYADGQYVPSLIVNGKEKLLATCGMIIATQSSVDGTNYVLVNKNNSWTIFVISSTGVVLREDVIVEEVGVGFFGYGGISFNNPESGSLFLTIPVTGPVGFWRSYNSICVLELDSKTLAQKNQPYILGWDDENTPPIYYGGVDGTKLMGWWDGQPFIKDLAKEGEAPVLLPVCQVGHYMAYGILMETFIMGVSPSGFSFWEVGDLAKKPTSISFQVGMGFWGTNGEQFSTQSNYENFYILTPKQ